MTQQDKELLLKDLCARLPYHPILNWKFIDNTSKDEKLKELSDLYIWWITKAQDCEVKPYLRPMSSITEEEKKEVSILFNYEFYIDDDCALVAEDDRHRIRLDLMQVYIDWLNAHQFDFRGLISKGLALEAKEGMYD